MGPNEAEDSTTYRERQCWVTKCGLRRWIHGRGCVWEPWVGLGRMTGEQGGELCCCDCVKQVGGRERAVLLRVLGLKLRGLGGEWREGRGQ